MNLTLRPTLSSDLEVFFQNQQDETAHQMAAFTAKDPNDRDAYMKKFEKLLLDDTITMNTIIVDGQIAGSLFTWPMEGDMQITYWIGRQFWGKGIATQALQLFLKTYLHRPIYGRIAFDNAGSGRVLEKCGFVELRREMYFANARGKEIEEIVFILSAE